MKNRFPIVLVALAALLAGFVPTPGASGDDEVRLRFFKVDELGSAFVLTWESEVEESVRMYEVQRRSTFSNGQFVTVQETTAQGVNRRYEYKDDQVFKSAAAATRDVVDYRLVAVYQSGARQILASQSVNYTSTALRRTWGSIKAMF